MIAKESTEHAKILASVNLFVLTALFLVHLVFASDAGAIATPVFYLIVVRFLVLVLELVWLCAGGFTRIAFRIYIGGSVVFNLGFGFVLALVANLRDSHYHVLMLIPIVAAALYFPLAGLIFTVLAATGLTFLNLHLYFFRNPPVDTGEYFEGTTTALIYAVGGAMIWLLVRRLQENQRHLMEQMEQLRLARDRLAQEEKLAAVGRLSSAIAHEIRNPVAVISSALETAMSASKDNQKDQILSLANSEAQRLTRLTEEFLSYARNKPPETSRVPVAYLVEYAVSIARPHAEKRGVRIESRHPADNVNADVDPYQIQQILLNLVLNALDETPAGGVVHLDAKTAADEISISIANTGKPISPEAAERIFEPFFTTKPNGTGLGLAIARKLADAHGGSLELICNTSERVAFELRLPLRHDG